MAKTFEGLHGDLCAPHHLGHVVVGREGEAERERGLGDRLCQTQSGEDRPERWIVTIPSLDQWLATIGNHWKTIDTNGFDD